MTNPLRVHYDEEGDFLEIAAGAPTVCYAEEIQPGIFLRRDEKTNEVKSIGIVGFKKRARVLDDMSVNLPVDLTFSPAIPA